MHTELYRLSALSWLGLPDLTPVHTDLTNLLDTGDPLLPSLHLMPLVLCLLPPPTSPSFSLSLHLSVYVVPSHFDPLATSTSLDFLHSSACSASDFQDHG